MVEADFVKIELIRWAIDRSQLPADELAHAFPKLAEWLQGERNPTFKQLEKFAKKTMTPLGYFFLDSPPEEELSIPDFRTAADKPLKRPSPNLFETIQVMQRRQDWMREYLIEEGQGPLAFVGSAKNSQNVVSLAARMIKTLSLPPDWTESLSTWDEAFRNLCNSAERIGILVTKSGIVGLNNTRKLAPEEFLGFALCDEYSPLIFVNGNQSKSRQMFTFAHELVHLWVGQDGLFNLVKWMPHHDAIERFCNQVAAEFLVPGHKLLERWAGMNTKAKPFDAIARLFKVSAVVAARRALDLKLINKKQFFEFFEEDRGDWEKREAQRKKKRGGGDFYRTQDVRLGKRFGSAVVTAAREGRLLYREAYQLTDLTGQTFTKYASRVIKRMMDERR